jgi:glycosyltransferase involved in cell wall biosynthesis
MIAYNESNALSGLFRDIALQDYPHDKIEVVFVDSMSTDDTKEKMESSVTPTTAFGMCQLFNV